MKAKTKQKKKEQKVQKKASLLVSIVFGLIFSMLILIIRRGGIFLFFTEGGIVIGIAEVIMIVVSLLFLLLFILLTWGVSWPVFISKLTGGVAVLNLGKGGFINWEAGKYIDGKLWSGGRVIQDFDEKEDKDGKIERSKPYYFFLGKMKILFAKANELRAYNPFTNKDADLSPSFINDLFVGEVGAIKSKAQAIKSLKQRAPVKFKLGWILVIVIIAVVIFVVSKLLKGTFGWGMNFMGG